MQLSKIALAASLLRFTVAQTPEGYSSVVSQTLSISYGDNSVSPAGELIPRPETADPPAIMSSMTPATRKSILFMVDLDVPRNGTRVPNLHWFVPGVTGTANSSLTIPDVDGSSGASYRQPSPPVGDSAHRYVFFLYEEPADFTIPAAFTNVSNNRIGFQLESFVEAAGLSPAYAANYITVQNSTGTTTQTFPPSSFTSTPTAGPSSSVEPVSGGAKVVAGGSWMALVMSGLWLSGML